jgi:uncharacterized membrane protein YphA (DoxX/SURF4 family)
MESLVNAFTAPMRHTGVSAVFCKALYTYLVIKIVLSWRGLTDAAIYHTSGPPKKIFTWLLYAPGEWGRHHMDVFLGVVVAVLLLALWLRPNYITASVIAWLALGLYRVSLPVANGSDQVCAVLLFLAIPLAGAPRTDHPMGMLIQRGIYHAARLFAQLYVASIYLVSGVDKLGSEVWRSGEAIGMVSALEYMVNPAWKDWIPQSAGGMFFLAWLTIVFELVFPVLVWFGATRKWVLIAGVVFHVAIGAFLSLPEFAAIMIISYGVFLRDRGQ